MNPIATTFVDFSLDVIKTCIDGLHTNQVNVTGSNVQDVLTFANFINLPDVADQLYDQQHGRIQLHPGDGTWRHSGFKSVG